MPAHQRTEADFYIDSEWSLTRGHLYQVYGVGIWGHALHVLVQDDDQWPRWCPAALFRYEPQPIPPHWTFRIYDAIHQEEPIETRWQAVWGYPDLVKDGYSDLLQEGDEEARQVFVREVLRREASH